MVKLMFKLGYFSDIYLELYPNTGLLLPDDILNNNLNLDILCILGDFCEGRNIENLLEFFKTISIKYEYIFYILGNHEFHNSEYFTVKKHIFNFFKDNELKNIFVLDNDHVKLDDCVFIGTTLWSDLANYSDIDTDILECYVDDYRSIKYQYNLITPKDTHRFHVESIEYIKAVCEKYSGSKIILLSHYSPSFKSQVDVRPNSLRSSVYCSDLEQLVRDLKIEVWLHGHTHHEVEYFINECFVSSNPKGYPTAFNTFKLKKMIV